jgi:hypothetical protein
MAPFSRGQVESEESFMEKSEDPLAQFGLDAIDLRWTMKDICCTTLMDNQRGPRV